jgi:glutamyl-tRNA synthetase
MNEIVGSLKWLGIDWDEGPDKGGPYQSYRQSERRDIYEKHLAALMREGLAYYCYCTHEKLASERENNLSAGKPAVYSRRCRYLTNEERIVRQAENPHPIIRFAVPERSMQIIVDDLIFKSASFDANTIGDFVIKKRDGMPTYNFAASIDDMEMKISHVIRGVDHLSNTPKQILIYQALRKKPPLFAHLPLLIGSDKQPLSKRHGDVSIAEFRAKGFLPRTLINYLALLGWSYDEKTTVFSKDELIEKFSVEKVSKSPAMFDTAKLEWMNGLYIRNMTAAQLADELESYLKYKGIYDRYDFNKITLEQVCGIIQEKVKTLEEFSEIADFLYFDRKFEDKAIEKLLKTDPDGKLLKAAEADISLVEPFERIKLELGLRDLADKLETKPSNLFQSIRIAISGKTITPGLFESLELLGKDTVLKRIEETLEKYF